MVTVLPICSGVFLISRKRTDRKNRPMTAGTAVSKSTELIVAPFGIEADHPRNSDLLIQCLNKQRLRSAIDGNKPATDDNGNTWVPKDQVLKLGSFPKTPGMQLHVNPAKCHWRIYDPLTDNPDLCERISRWMREEHIIDSRGMMGGVKQSEGTVDIHQMKSLVREMQWLVTAGEARVIKGSAPEMNEIDELPGYYLLDPGSEVDSGRPRYEKDLPSFVDKVNGVR